MVLHIDIAPVAFLSGFVYCLTQLRMELRKGLMHSLLLGCKA